MIKINIPKKVITIIEKLNQEGYEAYVVGGCVRDSILGKIPADWDITTSALPEQVKALFYKTIDTGLKHGTVTVLMGGEPFELTTYRIDGDYEDHRRPNDVSFTNELLEDLRRRDFTINAMAFNDKDGLIDAFSGLEDLNKGIIRCVGDPRERFEEDALRMLRAIRFAAKMSFAIDAQTLSAIYEQASLIENISGERLHSELTKILLSDNPGYIEKLYQSGLMTYILPEFEVNIGLEQQNSHHIYTVDQHIYETIKNIEATETLRWTMLLHDIGKGYCKSVDNQGIGHFYGHAEKSVLLTEKILDRLRFDNKTKKDVLKLIKYHDYRIEPQMKSVRKTVNLIGEELFLDYLKVQEADVMAQSPAFRVEHLKKLQDIFNCFEEIMANKECVTLKDLQLNGKDLLQAGISQGPSIGRILNQLLDAVLEEPSHNDKEWLLDKAKQIVSK